MHSYSHVYDIYMQGRGMLIKYMFPFRTDGIDCKVLSFSGGSSNIVSNVDMNR